MANKHIRCKPLLRLHSVLLLCLLTLGTDCTQRAGVPPKNARLQGTAGVTSPPSGAQARPLSVGRSRAHARGGRGAEDRVSADESAQLQESLQREARAKARVTDEPLEVLVERRAPRLSERLVVVIDSSKRSNTHHRRQATTRGTERDEYAPKGLGCYPSLPPSLPLSLNAPLFSLSTPRSASGAACAKSNAATAQPTSTSAKQRVGGASTRRRGAAAGLWPAWAERAASRASDGTASSGARVESGARPFRPAPEVREAKR